MTIISGFVGYNCLLILLTPEPFTTLMVKPNIYYGIWC